MVEVRNFLYVAIICATFCSCRWSVAGSDNSAPPENDADTSGVTLESLQADIASGRNLEDKLGFVKRVAALDDLRGKKFLIEYYVSLPTYGISPETGGNYYLKVGVFDSVLPLLDGKERESFLFEVMRSEVANMREAERRHVGNKYPGALWQKALKLMESGGLSPDMLGKLSAIGDDVSVPEDARSVFKACVVRQGFGTNSSEVADKIRDMLDKFPLRPEDPIPWEIYNDNEKRIAYSKRPEYKIQLAEFGKWRASGKLVKFETDKRVLVSYGVASFEQIVAYLAREEVSKDRRDCLAMVAAELLLELRDLSSQERETLVKWVVQLERYIDQMEDKGAHSYRSHAVTAMRVYYRIMGINEPHQFKEGRGPWVNPFTSSNMKTGSVVSAETSNQTKPATNGIQLINVSKRAAESGVRPSAFIYLICSGLLIVCLIVLLTLRMHKG